MLHAQVTMNSSLNDTSPYKSKVEDRVVGLRTSGYKYNLFILKKISCMVDIQVWVMGPFLIVQFVLFYLEGY